MNDQNRINNKKKTVKSVCVRYRTNQFIYSTHNWWARMRIKLENHFKI